MTDPTPAETVAVSPHDQSSDREQSDADQAVTVAALDRLAESSDHLSETATMLADSTRGELVAAKAQRVRFMWFMGIMAAVVAIFLAGLYYQTSKSNDVLSGSKQSRQTIIHLSQKIADCVNPTGKCYRDGQARTAKAIGSINAASARAARRAAAAAAACAPDYASLPLKQRIDAIYSCTVRTLP